MALRPPLLVSRGSCLQPISVPTYRRLIRQRTHAAITGALGSLRLSYTFYFHHVGHYRSILRRRIVVEIVDEAPSGFNKVASYVIESKGVRTGRAPAPKTVSSLLGKHSFLRPSVSGCCRDLVEACWPLWRLWASIATKSSTAWFTHGVLGFR